MDPRSRVHGTCVSLEELAARCRASADAKRVRARTWSNGPFGEVPRPPKPTPLDTPPPPAGPIDSWGRQNASWVLGGCLGGYLHRMRVWDPLAGPCAWTCLAWAEEACRAVEKATRFNWGEARFN